MTMCAEAFKNGVLAGVCGLLVAAVVVGFVIWVAYDFGKESAKIDGSTRS
jgi:ABC-type transporter Mla subunit MlaD